MHKRTVLEKDSGQIEWWKFAPFGRPSQHNNWILVMGLSIITMPHNKAIQVLRHCALHQWLFSSAWSIQSIN